VFLLEVSAVRERGTRRARTGLSIYLGTVVLVLGVIAATASAAPQPIGASDNFFTGGSGGSAPTYTMDQGDNPPFLTNNGPANGHDVQARQNGPDNGPLFFSTTLLPGARGPVHGTQYLSAGSYQFFCTIHPTEMQGTLVVTSNGTPQPRPSVALKVRTKTISKALKKGIVVAVTPSPTPAISLLSLVAKLGKTTIGKAKFPSTSPHSPTNVVQLSKAGKRKLRKRGAAKVTVVADVLFGAPTTAKGKLK
jgi:plastocyanin